MKNLKEFLNPKASSEQTDHIMKQLLQEKFDTELKEKYAHILQNDFDVQKGKSYANTAPKQKSNKILYLALAFLGILVCAYFAMNSFGSTNQQKVEQYLASTSSMNYNETMRSAEIESDALRTMAGKYFNDNDYQSSFENLSLIKDKTLEDQFYLAYSQMMIKEYNGASLEFSKLLRTIQKGEKFYNEAKLYYGLSLYALEDSQFQRYYDTLEEGSWEKEELIKMLPK